MSSTLSSRSLIGPIERAIDAWFDRERDGRAVAILLLVFVAAWTAFHVVSQASVDLHPDLLEVYAWGRHPSAGYYKHPPLGGLIAVFDRRYRQRVTSEVADAAAAIAKRA